MVNMEQVAIIVNLVKCIRCFGMVKLSEGWWIVGAGRKIWGDKSSERRKSSWFKRVDFQDLT